MLGNEVFKPPLADPQALQAIPEPPADRTELNVAAFREGEVEIWLSKAENTAPGDNRITYRHWKQVNPECKQYSIYACNRREYLGHGGHRAPS